jgi:hypothetical protein
LLESAISGDFCNKVRFTGYISPWIGELGNCDVDGMMDVVKWRLFASNLVGQEEYITIKNLSEMGSNE